MKEKFLNDDHKKRFTQLISELSMEGNLDVYWRSFLFIVAGNEQLFRNRKSVINFDGRSIEPDSIFLGSFSGGEQKLLSLAFNFYTNMDYYEDEEGNTYYISPLDVFSNLDKDMYTLAKNAIDVRLGKY
ncbi:DUF6075 family protein [Enterococcus sp. N249-2]